MDWYIHIFMFIMYYSWRKLNFATTYTLFYCNRKMRKEKNVFNYILVENKPFSNSHHVSKSFFFVILQFNFSSLDYEIKCLVFFFIRPEDYHEIWSLTGHKGTLRLTYLILFQLTSISLPLPDSIFWIEPSYFS